MIKFQLLWCVLIWTCANAQKVGVNSGLGVSCFTSSFHWNFSCPAEYLPYICHCNNDNFIATALTCINKFSYRIEDRKRAYHYIHDQCHYWGGRTMEYSEMQDIYTSSLHNLIEADEILSGSIVGVPVEVPNELYEQQLSAATDTKYRYKLGTIFGCGIILYGAVIMIGAMVSNFISTYHPKLFLLGGTRIQKYWQRYISLPPIIGKKHQSKRSLLGILSFQTPTRGIFFIILGFLVLNVCSVVTLLDKDVPMPLVFPNKTDKILRYLCNRTGIIAFTYLPLITLFAARNNPLIRLTGWTYARFQIFHRWSARMMVMHAVIHSVTITWFSMRQHVLLFKWKHVHNWRGGNIAVYFSIIMCILALRSFREKAYEFFVVSHKLLYLGFMVSLIVHCSDYGWLIWVWLALGINALDYIMRIIRIFLSGGVHKATFQLTTGEHFSVHIPGKRMWKVNQGQYIYIRILTNNLFWQSHPFSVYQSITSTADDGLDLAIKGKNGATNTIISYLKSKEISTGVFKVMIEGPYGVSHNITRYETIFILAGGCGITAMISYAHRILESNRRKGKVSLIWTVSGTDALEIFSEDIKYLRSQCDRLSFAIHITGSVNALRELDSEGLELSLLSSKESVTSYFDPEFIHYGRPDIATEIHEHVRNAGESLAVCCCGPPPFIDQVRDTIVQNLTLSDSVVSYFEDAYSW